MNVSPNSSKPHDRVDDTLVQTVTVEIRTHLLVLTLCILPTVVLVFPAILVMVALLALANAAVAVAPDLAPPLTPLTDPDEALLAWIRVPAAVVAGLAYVRWIQRTVDAEMREARCKPLREAKGQELVTIVHKLWGRLRTGSAEPPATVWFLSTDVSAHARDSGGVREIQVSAGLWDRATRGDPLGTAILAHEMAHLAYNDPVVFRRLEASVVAAQIILKGLFWLGVCTLIIGLLCLDFVAMRGAVSLTILVSQLAASILVGAAVMLIIPVTSMILRRYVGFIVSLMEIRADIRAALWTDGLGTYVRILRSDTVIHHSVLRDRVRSIFSPDLTHISETERIDLLTSPDHLATPKFLYAAFSLLLAFMVPVGLAAPDVFGVPIDYILVIVPVVAILIQTFAMLIIAAPTLVARPALLSLFTSAAAVCLLVGLPHFSTGSISYEMINLAGSVAVPGGIGGGETTWASTWSDLETTLADEWQKAGDAIYQGKIVAAIPLVSLCLWWLRWRASREDWSRPQRLWIAMVAASAAGLMTLLVSYNDFRGTLFSVEPLTIARPLAYATAGLSWIRAALPAFTVVACFEALSLFAAATRRMAGPG